MLRAIVALEAVYDIWRPANLEYIYSPAKLVRKWPFARIGVGNRGLIGADFIECVCKCPGPTDEWHLVVHLCRTLTCRRWCRRRRLRLLPHETLGCQSNKCVLRRTIARDLHNMAKRLCREISAFRSEVTFAAKVALTTERTGGEQSVCNTHHKQPAGTGIQWREQRNLKNAQHQNHPVSRLQHCFSYRIPVLLFEFFFFWYERRRFCTKSYEVIDSLKY